MFRLVVLLIVIVAIVALVVTVAAAVGSAGSAPKPVGPVDGPPRSPKLELRQFSEPRQVALGLSAVVAVGAAIGLGAAVGDGWPVVPLAAWVGLVAMTRGFATVRAQRSTDRVRRVGPFHAPWLDRAESAVRRIEGSKAAAEGWLGKPGELDFTPDLTLVTGSLEQGQYLQTLIDESNALPDASEDDHRMAADARGTVRSLNAAASERVELLEKCAAQAEAIDRMLADERAQARIAELRDDVRSRISAVLYGVRSGPDTGPSDSADAVMARVAAYFEIRDVMLGRRSAQ